jgi:membrane protein YqaA with SNARE-associated domain
MIAAGFEPVMVTSIATLGNWLGSMSTYFLGYLGNIERIERWLKISKEKTDKYRSKTERYGAWFGLLVWVPVIGDVLAVCMGLVRTPIIASTVLIFVGKALRYAIWCYLSVYAVS